MKFSDIQAPFQYLYQAFLRILVVLGVFSLCKIVFYYANAPYFSGISWSELFWILFVSIRFDLSAVIYTNLPVLLSYLLPFEFRKKAWYKTFQFILFVFCNAYILLIEVGDIEYFKFANRRTTIGDFAMATDFKNLLGQFLIDFWYLGLVWGLLLYFLVVGYRKTSISYKTAVNSFFLVQLGISCLGAGFVLLAARGGWQGRPLSPIDANAYISDMRFTPLVSNTTLNILTTFQERQLVKKHFYNPYELEKRFSLEKKPSQLKQPTNIVLLVLESFGQENSGLLGGVRQNTPFLDSLAKHSLYYEVSIANALRSASGIVSITAGLPNLMQEAFMFSSYQNNQLDGIAALLKKKGYRSAFFHGGNKGTMQFEVYSQLVGYHQYIDRLIYNNDKDYDGNWGIYDFPFLQYAAQEIDKMNPPFFATCFTMTSHHPFKVERFFEEKYPTMPIMDRSVLYADFALQKFFETAQKMDWYENTLFVLCADHTGVSNHAKYQTQIGKFYVPILFFKPDGSLKEKRNDIVQQIDIMPSILDYIGYDEPYFAFGKSVWDTVGLRYGYGLTDGQYHIADKDFLFVFSEQDKALGLYKYRTDSLLQTNLMTTFPKDKNRLEEHLKAVIQRHHEAMIHNQLSWRKK